MNATLLERLGEPIRQRYRASPVPAFLRWWGGELAALVPAAWSARLMPPKPQLWIVPAASGGGDLRLWRADGELRVLDVFGAGEDAALLRTRWRDLVAEFEDGNPEVRLLLPEDNVLALPVELPAAIEDNLSQALAFQVDQLTPFRPDQVWLGHRVESRDDEHGRIRVALRIAPLDRVNALVERVRAFGAIVHAVDTLAGEDPPRGEGFNLLPEARRPRYVHARARFNLLLGLTVVAVLAVVMVQSLVLRERSLVRLEAQAAALRDEARQTAELQARLEDSLAAANFLAERRVERPTLIELVRELTRVLPDNVWLQQFQLQGDELRIQGQAEGSQRVLGLLNESPLLTAPEFVGQIAIDPRTGEERFRAQARLAVAADPAEPDGAGS
ncbi:MAG: PilN domain-containing protein [Wenzhouxiangellaceae bacterium]|nr:PilN domain-containing protein [Wenzhouxiangellaceae bacterium]